MSFTDEQLLNLVNNTILTKSEFDINDFTGGGVQITSTHAHKIIKHKIYLTFGYDDKRNSRSYSEDIDGEISFIWQKAITLKVESLKSLNKGSTFSDLNSLMNTDTKIKDSDIEIVDRDKECNEVVPSSLRTPKLPMKTQIEDKLSQYDNINYDAFYEWVTHKKYKSIAPVTKLLNMFSKYNQRAQQDMVDKSIMNGWKGLVEPKQSNQPQQKTFKQMDSDATNHSMETFMDAYDNGFNLRNVNNTDDVQEVEMLCMECGVSVSGDSLCDECKIKYKDNYPELRKA